MDEWKNIKRTDEEFEFRWEYVLDGRDVGVKMRSWCDSVQA